MTFSSEFIELNESAQNPKMVWFSRDTQNLTIDTFSDVVIKMKFLLIRLGNKNLTIHAILLI